MDQFLTNDQLDKQDLLKSLETLPPEALSKMIEAVTGKPSQNLNSSQSKQEQSKNMVTELSGMNPTKFKKALVSMEKDDKIKVISNLTTKDKKNWDLFPKEALTASFSAAPKELILKGMEALKEDELGKIINNLPNELLTQSLTLLKPEVFAEQLLQKNSDLLARVLTSAA
jgi:Mg/Co/Ni transporter MgtE